MGRPPSKDPLTEIERAIEAEVGIDHWGMSSQR